MKLFAILIMGATIFSCKHASQMQENDIPVAVKTALTAKYPNVEKVKWESEDGNFEAAFESDDIEYAVLLDTGGNILETEIEIEVDALPLQIRNYVETNYNGQKITEATKITDASGNITFEAEIKDKDLIFDNAGSFIKEVLIDDNE